MIDIIKYDDGLPVSVIIPHTKTLIRSNFFDDYVYPLIDAMRPKEIIINTNEGGAPKKRNEGFDKSSQPYILFSDNDILFPNSFLEKLVDCLDKNPDKGYAYTGYYGIVKDPTNHPLKTNFRIPTMPFDGDKLKISNYISTMSLIRREVFPRFDESLVRFQDWDLFLTLLSKGIDGIAVKNNEFMAFYLDEGITSKNNNENEAHIKILKKHKLI